MNSKRNIRERGQTLVLVVLGFLAFVAVLALVLDGGNAYAAKRQAQNAADAGALAGAQYMCLHMNDDPMSSPIPCSLPRNMPVLNDADDFADVVADSSAATVVVNRHGHQRHLFCGCDRLRYSVTQGSCRSSMPTARCGCATCSLVLS